MTQITEDQFILSSRSHISISETSEMPDFEREAFINLLIKDIRTQNEQMKQQQKRR